MTDKEPRASKRPSAPSERRRRSGEIRAVEPEIRVAIAPAGRETLDAIANELAGPRKPSRKRPLTGTESAPEIIIEQLPAGRDTLAAIAEELGAPREPLTTLPYGDRVPNAPGATTPSRPPRSKSSRPAPALAPAASPAPAPAAMEAPEIFEMLTFVVRQPDPSALASDDSRRRFVSQHLAHRLPGGNLSGISRIDVTPWTERDTMILRLWCRVGRPD